MMYSALAEVYDLFGEDDAEARADYYCNFLPRGEGMDLGCGTGALTLELEKRGYRVYGVDGSAAMLGKAAEKATKAGRDIRFVLGDATDPPALHSLDFVLAANDVFNYVPHPNKAFAKIYRILSSGGVFAFDISSEYKLKNVLAGNTFSETKHDVTYVWRNFMERDRLIIDFTVFSPCGETYIKTCETQTQYVRKTEDVKNALVAAGFKSVKIYAFGKKTKPSEKTERVAFVAKK